MSESEAAVQPQDSAPSVGMRLSQARQAQGLSLGEMARQLKLSVKQVEALERDDYRTFPGELWVRGFLRNYAKSLGLDADQIIEKAGLATESAGATPAGGGVTMPADAQKERRRTLSFALAFVVLGLFVLALLGQRAMRGNANSTSAPSAPVAAPASSASHTPGVAAPTVTAPGVATPAPSAPSSEAAVTAASGPVPAQAPTTAPAPEASSVTSPAAVPAPAPVGAGAPSAASPNATAPTSAASSSAAAQSGTVSASAPATTQSAAAGVPPSPAAAPVPSAASESSTSAAPVSVGAPTQSAPNTVASPTGAQTSTAPEASPPTKPRTLRFAFTQSVDVEVQDAEGKVLLSKLQAAGTERAVRGLPPFTVSVANVHAVSLTYRGRPVDLVSRSKNGSARITLK